MRCKAEIWRVQFALAKIRKAARELLTLDEKDPRRVFEGPALLRRCVRAGLLEQDKADLDYVLQLTTQKLLERRLQVGREGGREGGRAGGRVGDGILVVSCSRSVIVVLPL